MKLSQFKFKLPEDKIALHPAKYRVIRRLDPAAGIPVLLSFSVGFFTDRI